MNRLTAIFVAIGLLNLTGTQSGSSSSDRWVPDDHWFMQPRYNERPMDGYIRKKETAIQIGRAIMLEYYGKDFMKEMEPLDAKLFGDVWLVYNHLPKADMKEMVGGPTTVQISRSTGAILNVCSER